MLDRKKDIRNLSFPFRLFIISAAIYSLLGILVAGLWNLQMVHGKKFRTLSEENRLKLIPISPPRGIIYDRNMAILVDNQPSFNVGVIPEEIDDIETVSETLGKALTIPAEAVREMIADSGRRKFEIVPLKKDVDRKTATFLEERKTMIPGLVVQLEARRNYVLGNFASHLLGYVGEISADELERLKESGYRRGDIIGKFGVEKFHNEKIMGTRGWKWRVVNVLGKEVISDVPLLFTAKEPVAGDSVVLTIDKNIQKAAEDALGDRKGAVVAMDPRNGDILALASSPGFDPNIFSHKGKAAEIRSIFTDERSVMMNRATQGEYPLGSVFKLVIAAAALEEGVIKPETRLSCGGAFRLPGGNAVFRCWRAGGHGALDLINAIKNSCNVYFYQTGVKLGIDRIEKYARLLGFGGRTGIDLPYEAAGFVPSEDWKKKTFGEKWYPGESAVISIGQGYLRVTPLQVAAGVAAIANGGRYYRPRILKGVLGGKGEVDEFEPVVEKNLNVSGENLRLIREGMWKVVNEDGGTARKARIEGFGVCGKTGTAQTVSRNSKVQGEKRLSHAWFTGFAPFENPSVAVAVFVEHGGYGGTVAAPIARKVMAAALGVKEDVVAGL